MTSQRNSANAIQPTQFSQRNDANCPSAFPVTILRRPEARTSVYIASHTPVNFQGLPFRHPSNLFESLRISSNLFESLSLPRCLRTSSNLFTSRFCAPHFLKHSGSFCRMECGGTGKRCDLVHAENQLKLLPYAIGIGRKSALMAVFLRSCSRTRSRSRSVTQEPLPSSNRQRNEAADAELIAKGTAKGWQFVRRGRLESLPVPPSASPAPQMPNIDSFFSADGIISVKPDVLVLCDGGQLGRMPHCGYMCYMPPNVA